MTSVLVVDDEKLIQSVLKKVLEKYTYQVDIAESVTEAFQLLSKNQYHAVICDIVLPEKNGLDLIRLMHANNIKVPVILITGHPEMDYAQEAVKLKAFDFLTKPINNDRLLEILHNAVQQHHLQLESENLEKRKNSYLENLEKMILRKVKLLRESEAKFKNLLDQTLIGVYFIQRGRYVQTNQKFRQMFRIPENENIRGILPKKLISEKNQAEVSQNLKRLLKKEVENLKYTFTAMTYDGTEFEVEVWESVTIFEDKEAIQGIILDVSDLMAFDMKEKAFHLNLIHEHKLASIGLLATGIAHNLNTPISVILGNAELLQLKYSDSPEITKIIRQAERMSGIIQGLLTKSKQEQLRKPQPIDLNLLISTELEFLSSNLEFKHNVKKEYHFDDKIPEIYAIYSDFSQSIMNLIQNAIDAMHGKDDKILSVITSFEDDFIYVKIKDSGWGIAEENYSKLFDPFYTTKPVPIEQKSDEPTGTGLGLSTVYNLLTPYGVEIEISSQVNFGSTFTLKIPVEKMRVPEQIKQPLLQ